MQRAAITLKSTVAIQTRYQGLSARESSAGTCDPALRLVEELLRSSGVSFRYCWLAAGKSWRGNRRELILDAGVFDALLTLHQHIGIAGLPAVPDSSARLLESVNEAGDAALRAWVYLTLPAVAEVDGETEFFRDAQSMLFLDVIECLLPELKSSRLKALHDVLVNALAYHSTVAWRDEPSRQQYLLAALARYQGNRELQGKALLASFRMADPEDNDYLRRAKAYWTYLWENRRYEDAESFLMGVYRRALPGQLDEVSALLDKTRAKRLAAR